MSCGRKSWSFRLGWWHDTQQSGMKSFSRETYRSRRIDFQWKTKTPPCPTEKTKNKQKAVYWLFALKRKMH